MSFRQTCESKDIPIISIPTEEYLSKKINRLKPKNILEIGSAVCYSTIFFANLIKEWNWKITTFELSQPSYRSWYKSIINSWLKNIIQYNYDFLKVEESLFNHEINICHSEWSDSGTEESSFKNTKKSLFFDFIFIDARKSEYKDYFLSVQKYTQVWTTIIFDDVIKFKNKMQSFYDYLKLENIKYEILQLDKDDWILIIEM